MIPNPYLYEKLIATRQAEIRHEIQQSRMKAHARRRGTLVRSTVGSFGSLLIVLGSFLQRTRQGSGASLRS